MRVTNRNEIHRRRIWFMKLNKSGMRLKDIAVYFDVDPSTVRNGIKRIMELIDVYGDAVLDDSWPRRDVFSRKDIRITGSMLNRRLKSKIK